MSGSSHALTLEERVAAQRAIEQVYWNHRRWPAENGAPKPPLETVLPEGTLRARVEDYLKKSNALAEIRTRPITPVELQAEMERMAAHTRAPDVLRELFDALGNDPALIAETLVRASLADRSIRSVFSRDAALGGERSPEQRGGGFESWWASRSRSTSSRLTPEAGTFSLPAVTASPCALESWSAIEGTPDARVSHTAVWTGAEMIVWGGDSGDAPFGTYFRSGGRFDPATNTWAATSTVGAPTARTGHTSVWTGTEMIVWGGDDGGFVGSGGRYNPTTDAWVATSTTGSPAGRYRHTSVWTGAEMIVWGGDAGSRNFPDRADTGGRYDPVSDHWVATSTTSAPSPRVFHTAVWTGTEMIVWGGYGVDTLATGGRYDPASDSWVATATVGAPQSRDDHAGIWTGQEMIVWGGESGGAYLSSGGRYDPASDTWIVMPTTGAPTPREGPAVVWTGTEMVVWGGYFSPTDTYFDNGARFDPVSGAWHPTSTFDAPRPRRRASVVWTGAEMIVWGGYNGARPESTGGRYDPVAESWKATGGSPRSSAYSVWTGAEMIVWGGIDGDAYLVDGVRYDPATDLWRDIARQDSPSPRSGATAVWTGTEMIVWGGWNPYVATFLETGGRYNPTTDTWAATSTDGAPIARHRHTAVWSGTEMIVWGGAGITGSLASGGRYDPSSNQWTSTSMTNAPQARSFHAAVWGGGAMLVWGGLAGSGYLDTGGRYIPSSDSWQPTTTTGAPSARRDASAIWTGTEMLVWGGYSSAGGYLGTGGRYSLVTQRWSDISTTDAPGPRAFHSAVWTGSEMIVWGGYANGGYFQTGGRYDPESDAWAATSTLEAPEGRLGHVTAWTGTELIVLGGSSGNGILSGGGRYCAAPCASPTPAGSPRIRQERPSHGTIRLVWLPVPDATAYDVVRGSLADLLATSGDFAASTGSCLADDLAGTSLEDSDASPASGVWYLVRAVSCGGSGTYDAEEPSRVGSRDAEIAASGAACP